MGARQSKRSVDIAGATKKGELEGGVEDGKLERLEEGDVAVTPKAIQNGSTPHVDKEASSPVVEEVKPLENGDSKTKETEIAQEQEVTADAEKKEDGLANGTSESVETKEKTEEPVATPDKEKKKEKSKKKWSFRSFSFSRKDKSKPNIAKDEATNGNVTKEEPVAEVVEAEAAAVTEAIPVKDEEAKKEGDAPVRPEEEEEKKEKTETTTETEAQSTQPASPVPLPAEPAPTPVPEPVSEPTPIPEPVVLAPEPVVPTPVEIPVPETVPEPIVEAVSSPPVVEAIPEPVQEELEKVPVAVEEAVVEAVTEAKVEELPPPLPASPPPTEAPPPTPVAPVPPVPDVSLHVDSLVDTQETEVVGGGESMAEPVDVEPVLEEEKLDEAPLVNGISEHTHQFVEEISEKVEIVTENFKTIVTDSIISTQVSENTEDNSEQTASAAE